MEKTHAVINRKMKANELRINNKVKCKISNDSAVYVIVAIDAINNKVMLSGARMGKWISVDKIKPIELTEDVLLKCGFRKSRLAGHDSHFTYSIFMGGEVINITAIYNADFSIMLHSSARKTKYLHELQNRLFAITKQELEVNL